MDKSPFSISEQDWNTLESSKGFRIVRTYLSKEQDHAFCTSHSNLPTEVQSTFVIHRDILHSLLLPILSIRSQAALFASHTLASQRSPRANRSPSPPRSVVDLELAFRSQARGAFSWLQCFIAEERDWCTTKGCPACVVLKVLHAEPFIRVVVAACRLSTYLKDLLEKAQHSRGAAPGDSGLPSFEFWLTAVHRAVSEDSFWGLHFWEDIEARAEDLEAGIKELISQCSQPTSANAVTPAHPPPMRCVNAMSIIWAQDVKNGRMVKRQMRLREEEHLWMAKIIEACWKTMVSDAARERRKISTTRRPIPPRLRSLTT